MPQENVEIVRRQLVGGVDLVPLVRDDATWTRRRAEIEAIVEPDWASAWVAYGQRFEVTGLDEERQGWLDFFEAWESVRNEIERIIPVGDKVVVLTRLHGRMAETQHEVELISATVYLIRGGRVARAEHYANRTEALEAVGLRE